MRDCFYTAVIINTAFLNWDERTKDDDIKTIMSMKPENRMGWERKRMVLIGVVPNIGLGAVMKWKWFIVGILLYIGILYPISFFTSLSCLSALVW